MALEFGVCRAYPANGTNCARIVGTLCGGQVQGSFASKLPSCMRCDFYNSVHYCKTEENSPAE